MKLVRTFHPVGHGAFYTERFYDEHNQNVANIVFDCGCYEAMKPLWSREKFQTQINDRIDKEFPLRDSEKICIDALFISHFHEDHINGIPRLLKSCDVKRIIMPKLTDDALLEILLSMWVEEMNDFKGPLDAIEQFLTAVKDKIVEVGIDGDFSNGEVIFANIDIKSIPVGSILSPTMISVQGVWKYIPFSTKEKTTQLRQLLINAVPELSQSLSVNPIDFRQIAAEFTKKPQLLSDCKSVYSTVYGGNKHNRYSMTLFSGTCDKYTTCTRQCHQGVVDLPRYCTKNCLYMGDFEADPTKSLKNTNCEQLLKFYERSWSKIGMFQVPHHGSRDNINVKLYSPPKLGIISAGKEDVYLNPHVDVIHLLQQHNCVPLIVTEDPTTIQKFYYKIR